MALSPPSAPPDPLYGSPNQHSRAQQSRHQLVASTHSAASSPRSLSPTDPLSSHPHNQHHNHRPQSHHASDPTDPYYSRSSASNSDPLPTAQVARDNQPAQPPTDPYHLDEVSSLSEYPSIREIQAEAARHQQYYYAAEDASFGRQAYIAPQSNPRWWNPKPRRRPLERNQESYRSIAHPFETFSDSGHDHDRTGPAGTFHRFTHLTSEFGRKMQANGGANGRAAGPSSDGAVGGAGGASPRYAKFPGAELYNTLQWSRQRPPITKERKLQLLRSYLPDWIITILLAGLLALINRVHGFRREFDLNDTSIQHTFAVHERVPMWLLGLTAVIIPALLIATIALGASRSVWDLHNGLLGFLLAHCLNVTVTTIIKVCVGRPRPDLIDRCQPWPGSINATPYGLSTDAICSVGIDDSRLRDGFRSFPSGHASSAFAGLTFLTLYLAGKLHLFDRRGHALSAWLTVCPMMGAALIAISRTMDYRHHATDIIAGAILGTVLSYSVYRLYYPPLHHPQCHKPYSPRIPREGIVVPRLEEDLEDAEMGSELDDTGRGYTTVRPEVHQPAPGTGDRSDSRMLSAAQNVVHGYERSNEARKAPQEDEYVSETVDRA
ncbi:hypothetical protein ACQY0O_006002 [Thecaphora frezii]|nr:putative phosphatidic acid phosphatase [Thecaphora frezii]